MQKFHQSDTSVMAGIAGKDLATFRHAKTWESRKPVPFNCFARSRRIIILIILYNFKYSLEMSLILIRNFKFGFILLSIHSISISFLNCCE